MERGKPGVRTPWSAGTLAYLFNRIAGTVLALYLIVHIVVISTARRNPGDFDGLMQRLHSPFWLAMEIMLTAAVVFHAVNGVRLILIDASGKPRGQRRLFWWTVGISAAAMAVVGIIYVPIIVAGM